MILPKFPEHCMKPKEFEHRRCGGEGGPLRPPLRSANEYVISLRSVHTEPSAIVDVTKNGIPFLASLRAQCKVLIGANKRNIFLEK